MPTKSTHVIPNEIFAILILPKSSPMKMDKDRYNTVGPTPEPVNKFNMMVLICVNDKMKEKSKVLLFCMPTTK